MPSVFTIQGPSLGRKRRRSARRRKSRGRRGLGQARKGECKCVYNPKTRRRTKLCYVGKSKKHPTGWSFKKGPCR